jgi:hypothetical protein
MEVFGDIPLQFQADAVTQLLSAGGTNVALPTDSAGNLPKWIYISATDDFGFIPTSAAVTPPGSATARGTAENAFVLNVAGFTHLRVYRFGVGGSIHIAPLENS